MNDHDVLGAGRDGQEPFQPGSPVAGGAAAPLPGGQTASAGGPLLPAATGREDVLGLRVAAALIDLVLLAGLFLIMSLSVGRFSVAGGSLSVSLDGVWLAVFLVLVLLYHFTLEAWTGRTVGKHVLGLQVHGAAGGRASVRAAAGRTLLRIVDWLPVLYLAGFITMMATGARRQRIGDIAARTSVVRAPVRHRGLALVPLALVVLAALGLSAYRASSAGGTQAYRGHGVSFDYPAGWHTQPVKSVSTVGPRKMWQAAVGPGTKLDLIIVSGYRIDFPVTARNIDVITPLVESASRQFFGQLAGAVQAGPEKITMAGMPALRFRGTGTLAGSRFESTIVFAFSGRTEYFVNCQHTAAGAAEVDRACGQVVGSFQVRGSRLAAGGGLAPPWGHGLRATPA